MVANRKSCPSKSRRGKKSKPRFLDLEMVSRLRDHVDDRWPNLGWQFASLVRVSKEKLDDLYSSAAEVIIEHKEAFEDRRAEEKARARAVQRGASTALLLRPENQKTVNDEVTN